jgi:hypothetical protein
MWSDLFENSFNYYYQYTYKMFNPDIRIGTDDDVVVMGDVTVVLPFTKQLEESQRKEIKDTVIDALKARYKKDKSVFRVDATKRKSFRRR